MPFHRVEFDQADIDAVEATLRSGWITSGPRVRDLEAWLEKHQGVAAVAVASCTQALEAAVSALAVGQGRTVLTPSLTFTATSAAIERAGCIPDWVDIDQDTGLLTPDAVAAAITDETVAALTVDYAGRPVDYSGLRRVCEEREIAFISDAAHSFGATVDGQPIGALADATCLSFYATKNIAGGEGGALLTRNNTWIDYARSWRLHGMTAGAEDRYRGGANTYDVEMLGSKANMTDITAALVLSQAVHEAAFRERRTMIANQYLAAFAELPSVRLPTTAPGHSWHLFVIRVPAESREPFIRHLASEGIATSVHFRPVHQMSYWRRLRPRRPLPNTEDWGGSCVSLPLFPAMTTAEVSAVIEAVHAATENVHC